MGCLRQIVFTVATAFIVLHVFGIDAFVRRSDTSNKQSEPCEGSTPCGWAIYNKTTRFVEYFMRNRCFCDGEKKCIRDNEDISISGFIYRCKIEEPQGEINL